MGQTTSSIAKKVSDWTRSKEENPSPPDTSSLSLSKAQVNPFVYRRIRSASVSAFMDYDALNLQPDRFSYDFSRKFVDADGDIAHEFYVQQTITYKTPNSRKRKSKVIMKKVSEEDLTPVVSVFNRT